MEVARNRKKYKINFGQACTKYMLFVLNFVFVIASVLMISGAISSKIIFTSYYSNEMTNGTQMLSTFWLIVGIVFMFVAMFGIFAAFKESTVLANLYAIAMIVVFIFQMAAAIAGFTLISRSRNMVGDQLYTWMNDYYYDNKLQLDWIQYKFECCGQNGPSDWQRFGQYSTPSPYNNDWYNNNWYDRTTPPPEPAWNNDDYYYRTTPGYPNWGNDDYYYRTTIGYPNYPWNYQTDNYGTTTTERPTTTTERPTTTTEPPKTTTTEAPRTNLTPVSCCVQNSDYVNLTCSEHYQKGCFDPIHQIVSESIMMIGSSALVFAVVQVLGIVLGFLYARVIRRQKTQRDVQVWNSEQRSPATPVYADYTQVDNQGEVKYI